VLNLMVTHSWLSGQIAALLGEHGVTLSQFNVLRILRGSHPDRLTCSDIGERLLDRTPDVTRLLDRLTRAGLTERARAEHDRRVVLVGITPKGLELLASVDPGIERFNERLADALPPAEMKWLSDLLDQFRLNAERLMEAQTEQAA
jgi:DNA-binding MarR family transcriptional regulator